MDKSDALKLLADEIDEVPACRYTRALFRLLALQHLKRLGELWEKAMRGSVSSPVWPL